MTVRKPTWFWSPFSRSLAREQNKGSAVVIVAAERTPDIQVIRSSPGRQGDGSLREGGFEWT